MWATPSKMVGQEPMADKLQDDKDKAVDKSNDAAGK